MLITHKQFQPKNIRYGFFTREVSLSKGYDKDQPKAIATNFCGAENLAIVEQKHTNTVMVIKNYEDSNCIADGQVTNKSNLALAVLTADCVPILLADENAGIVATIHSGWRGARASIMNNAVEKMQELGAKDITAIIGPCIKQRSYEVDQNFYEDFISESIEHKNLFIPSIKENHYMFDLPGYVKRKLAALEIKQILDIDRNTYEEEDNFFSFRRTTHHPESKMGSLISFIMLI